MLSGMASMIAIRAKKATGGGGGGVTPNPIDYPDSLQDTRTQRTTIGQQITGISSTITLKVNSADGYLYSWEYGINSTNSTPSSWTSIGITAGVGGDTSSFTVSNNDWLFFRYYILTQDLCTLRTATVINVSDSNAVLDTWQAQLRPRAAPCP